MIFSALALLLHQAPVLAGLSIKPEHHSPPAPSGQLLQSFHLVEPTEDESLSPTAAPAASPSASSVPMDAEQAPAHEELPDSNSAPPESAAAVLEDAKPQDSLFEALPQDPASAADTLPNALRPERLHQVLPLNQTSQPTAAEVMAGREQDSQQLQNLLPALPKVPSVRAAVPELVKSASSVSQQSIMSYGQCIRELQLKKLRQGTPQPAGAEDDQAGSLAGGHNQQAAADCQQQPGNIAHQAAASNDAVLQLCHVLKAAPSDPVSGTIDDAPQLSVSAVLQRLQSAATAPIQPPQLPVTADCGSPQPEAPAMVGPQLAAIATGLPPGSPTRALLPGTGVDLLERPGSSPLPVSKMLRMVSEDQATLLSDLAAQCAAPGGLLGTVSQGQFGTAPADLDCADQAEQSSNPSAQLAPSDNSAQQLPHAQHAQGSSAMPTASETATLIAVSSCTAGDSTDTAQQTITAESAGTSGDQADMGATGQLKRSPLRKRLSQIFSPILGSSSNAASVAQQQQQQLQLQHHVQLPQTAQSVSQSPVAQQQAQHQHTSPDIQAQHAQQPRMSPGVQTQQAKQPQQQQHLTVDAGLSSQLGQQESLGRGMQHRLLGETAAGLPFTVRSPSPPFRPLALLNTGKSGASLHGMAQSALYCVQFGHFVSPFDLAERRDSALH